MIKRDKAGFVKGSFAKLKCKGFVRKLLEGIVGFDKTDNS